MAAPQTRRPRSLQAGITRKIREAHYKAFISDLGAAASPAHRAHFLGLGGSAGGLWMSANPAVHELRTYNRSWRLASLWHLHLPFVPSSFVCDGCQSLSDPYGYHARTCSLTNTRNTAHLRLRDAFVTAAAPLLRRSEWKLQGETAVTSAGYELKPGAAHTRADACFVPGSIANPARIVDFIVTDAATVAALEAGSANARGTAASLGDKAKVQHYTSKIVSIRERDIQPFAIEAQGYLSEGAWRIIKFVAFEAHNHIDPKHAHARVPTNPAYGNTITSLATLISVTLMQGEVLCIDSWLQRCVPKSPAAPGSAPLRTPSRARHAASRWTSPTPTAPTFAPPATLPATSTPPTYAQAVAASLAWHSSPTSRYSSPIAPAQQVPRSPEASQPAYSPSRRTSAFSGAQPPATAPPNVSLQLLIAQEASRQEQLRASIQLASATHAHIIAARKHSSSQPDT